MSQVLANDRQSFAAALHDLSGALATVKNFIDSNRALISSNVKKLAVITQALSAERDSLAEALRTAPLAVDNLINAYDPQHNTLDGRADLNELSLWPSQAVPGNRCCCPTPPPGGTDARRLDRCRARVRGRGDGLHRQRCLRREPARWRRPGLASVHGHRAVP